MLTVRSNRPFPSSPVPLFQNESKCKTIHMKMSAAPRFIFMQIKVIFIRKVSHLDSFRNRGTRELGIGLLWKTKAIKITRTFINLVVGTNLYFYSITLLLSSLLIRSPARITIILILPICRFESLKPKINLMNCASKVGLRLYWCPFDRCVVL